jgi:N-acetylmuramoyl-L-alanine amidase
MIFRLINLLNKAPQAKIEEPVTVINIVDTPSFDQTKTLLISAGHSNTDPGAVGNGYTEADIVLEFRDLVANELKSLGVSFTKDGEKGDNLPLSTAIKLATEHDISIEFHCNAFTNPNATGVETLSHSHHYPIGQQICNVASNVLGIANRGAKGESSGQHSRLGFIARGNGIIVELFFISNPNDVRKYQENKHTLAYEVAVVLRDLVAK